MKTKNFDPFEDDNMRNAPRAPYAPYTHVDEGHTSGTMKYLDSQRWYAHADAEKHKRAKERANASDTHNTRSTRVLHAVLTSGCLIISGLIGLAIIVALVAGIVFMVQWLAGLL